MTSPCSIFGSKTRSITSLMASSRIASMIAWALLAGSAIAHLRAPAAEIGTGKETVPGWVLQRQHPARAIDKEPLLDHRALGQFRGDVERDIDTARIDGEAELEDELGLVLATML